jgi:hypothetical protein
MAGCPPDLFEQLNLLVNSPREYNHLLAKTIDELCRALTAETITWDNGIPYIKDPVRDKWISLGRTTIFAGYYGLMQCSRYMRMSGVTMAGEVGFYVPSPATITGLWGKSRSITEDWILEVRKNNIPITVVSVSIINGEGANQNINIDLDAGDYIQLYMNGSGVSHPIAVMDFAWRLVL